MNKRLTQTSVGGNVRCEAVNICAFAEAFGADWFLCSNVQSVLLSASPPKSFREFAPSHVVSWFAATRVVFLPQPLTHYLTLNRIDVIKALQPSYINPETTCISGPTEQFSAFLTFSD